MKKNLITLSQFDSLASDAAKKVASVASATREAIEEVAAQVAVVGDDYSIVASSLKPEDSNAYWLYIDDSTVRMKGTGTRDPVYFASHIDCVEGFVVASDSDINSMLDTIFGA